MRADEIFVMNALVATFGGSWKPGQDPPDAYLILAGKSIAIEISTLTQHVRNDHGEMVPRLSQDVGAIEICDALDVELRRDIPNGVAVSLVLTAPITKARKLRELLAEEIRRRIRLSSDESSTDLVLGGNPVRLIIHEHSGQEGKKVVGLIVNRNSSADIQVNAWQILEERLKDKSLKCGSLANLDGIWLALLNDYDILADVDSYRLVFPRINVKHPFQRILLVSTNGQVATVYEA